MIPTEGTFGKKIIKIIRSKAMLSDDNQYTGCFLIDHEKLYDEINFIKTNEKFNKFGYKASYSRTTVNIL